MGYLATERSLERRSDPKRILPGCKSILVLGIHYQPAALSTPDTDKLTGRVASYAWGEDYHVTDPGRLNVNRARRKGTLVGPIGVHGHQA